MTCSLLFLLCSQLIPCLFNILTDIFVDFKPNSNVFTEFSAILHHFHLVLIHILLFHCSFSVRKQEIFTYLDYFHSGFTVFHLSSLLITLHFWMIVGFILTFLLATTHSTHFQLPFLVFLYCYSC